VKTKKLRPHPINLDIYSDQEDLALDEDIKRSGIREPLIINSKYEILNGVRRFNRALKYGIEEVPAIVKDYQDEELAIVMGNKYRQKTPREIYLESKILEKRFKDTVKVGRPPRGEDYERGKTLADKVSNELGISRGKLYQIKKVYDNQEKIPKIVEALENGTISVSKAAQAATLVLEDGLPETKVLRKALKSDITMPIPKKSSRGKARKRDYIVKCPVCNAVIIADKKVNLKTIEQARIESRLKKRGS